MLVNTSITVHTRYQCYRRPFLLDFQCLHNPKKATMVLLLLLQGYCNYSQCYFIVLYLLDKAFNLFSKIVLGPQAIWGYSFYSCFVCFTFDLLLASSFPTGKCALFKKHPIFQTDLKPTSSLNLLAKISNSYFLFL